MEENKNLKILTCVLALMLLPLMGCSNGDPTVKITNTESKLKDTPLPPIKVFLENSGSMDGFMCDRSELKDGIYNYLTAINSNCGSMSLYYINSDVLKQGVTLQQYIRNLSPANFKNAGGNRAFSDIPTLFDNFLSQISDNTVGIYISDCILDIPNKSAPNFLNITRTDIHNVFSNKLKKDKDFAVCIYQLESTYNGMYFFPTGGSQKYNGKRPYYMILAGNRTALAQIRKSVSDSEITHGIKNYCAFTNDFKISAILSQGNRKDKKLSLKTKNRDSGRYEFNVLVDFDQTLQNDSILTDKKNYKCINNKSKINIEEINRIIGNNPNYSHMISFSINDDVFSDRIWFTGVGLPKWVSASNGNKADMVENGKTFGIEYIIGGISDAFSKKEITSIDLEIKH